MGFYICLVIMVQTAFAINSVAVLELLPKESVEGKISIEESRHLTDELRRQAVTTLPKSGYSVMTRDNIIALIPPDEKEAECLAESCAVDIGRAIGAEFITQGTIGKFGDMLTISVELYETMGAKLLYSIVFESKDIKGLLDVIRKEAKPLFQSILSEKLSEPEFSEFQKFTESSKSLNQVNQGSDKGNKESSIFGIPQWLGIGFAVASVAAVGFGIYQHTKAAEHYNKYKDKNLMYQEQQAAYNDVEKAKLNRNILYIVGGTLLATGVTIYVWF